MPQDHALASVLHQQAPAAFQTPWSVPAQAAAAAVAASNPAPNSPSFQPAPSQQPVANFTVHRPPLIYAPNTNGLPGFETFGATPRWVALRGVTSMTCLPQVSKHDRGTSAVDIEKIVNIATAS